MDNKTNKKRRRYTTIFKQLILNVIFPVVVALVALASLNYYQTQTILHDANQTKNYIISNEIKHIMELQDVGLEAIEEQKNQNLKKYSYKLVEEYFPDTKKIEEANLKTIRKELGMDPNYYDIYIINKQGIVVNTTFEKDLNLNFFDFGEEHKQYLLKIFEEGEFVSERFAIEASTKRLKKFTYHPTLDNNYIIELGSYSPKADKLINRIQNILETIAEKEANIISVDLFISEEKPFSLTNNTISSRDSIMLSKTFASKDTNTIKVPTDTAALYYEYIYMERENTDLYKKSVIRIVSDRSRDKQILSNELIKSISISLVTILLVIIIIYYKTRVITSPIKRLVANVNRIAKGDLTDRALIEGSNEIATLSKHFNRMIERIEEYYNVLEQKVADRTKEIEQQKEEITAQRDSLADKNQRIELAYKKIEEQNLHITDSIKYAEQIQKALLPPEKVLLDSFPDSFVLFKPKDIVSGDFYWTRSIEDKRIFVAADCTGHGVPGAFMSLLGISSLNEIVTADSSDDAAKILDRLRKYIKKSLRQTGKEKEQKDGIDLSLCIYAPEKKKLLCAGANNSIVLIRDKEIELIKADRMPIGIYRKEHPFTNHEIDVRNGDIIYMFSDGYQDQFGGPEGRKFLAKNFRKLLLEVHELPLEQQRKEIDITIKNWMKDEEQVDDILVVGLKL
ncbi:MAG TPA: SpoIIE family protein phosphatase [Salinivirga sp.]|uniref:SpoIIE family protein phosphatase n=1 Tax=Salinivirga sp. TaxID=1970192 RepID=UPI002B473CF2|nr:SpoIIE family protein phosphatase [Salinivirga sp.]HKK59491.1 SpoIIE family protein phosphatase [Salinivirga sp.]